MVELREYQTRLIRNMREALQNHRRVLVVLPTGGGKTVIAGFVVRGLYDRDRSGMFLVHREELLTQTVNTFNFVDVPHGIVAAGYRMARERINIGMVGTVARRLEYIPSPDIILIDEAHHAVAGTWRKIVDAWPNARIIGLTATPERMDGKGLDDVFDEIVIGPTTAELIELGHLARFDYFAPTMQIDLSGVRSVGGDYEKGALGRVMNKPKITGDIIDHYSRHLKGAPSIAFCVSIEHAEAVAEQFRSQGFRATSIDGKLDANERARRVAALRSGEIQVLTSCDLISEGFDVPSCWGALLLRPTRSLAMFLQQIGRVLRPKPDGSKATILDHVGNVDKHGLPDALRNWTLQGREKKRKDDEDVGVTTCQTCFKVMPSPGSPCGAPRCPYSAESIGPGRPEPEQVAGVLDTVSRQVSWCPGVDVSTAKGDAMKTLLRAAGEDAAKLAEIARLRGYSEGWIEHRIHSVRAIRERFKRA